MQSLQFKKIRICSESEQKAFSQKIHPLKNLFIGTNSTGKSTIVKSLFRAFDAEPAGTLRGWDYGAIVAVDFSVSGIEFTSLRRGDLKALFQGDKLLGATTSSSEWNKIFSKAVGFSLQISDKNEKFGIATPAMFFLPFYINQDGSFFETWDTFKNAKHFDSNAILSTLEYFTRIRPPRYFELKGGEKIVNSKLAELKIEISTLHRTRQKLQRSLKASPVKLTKAGFQREVQQLTIQANTLGQKQEKLRREMVETQELSRQLGDQILLLTAALAEHDADFKTINIATADGGAFRCPTCHAEHDVSFHSLLELAEDAREVYSMKQRLQENLISVNGRLERLKDEAVSLRKNYQEVTRLLAVKKGRITFEDVVKSYGADAADIALDKEIDELQKSEAKLFENSRNIKTELKSLANKNDVDSILARFREKFKELLIVSDVQHFDDSDKWRINKRPSDSGSPGPRAVVAYYAALWDTMQDEAGNLPAPLVIDSPNQNAQDPQNLRRVMALLADRTPQNAQVILCSEERAQTFKADQTIFLQDKRSLLKRELMESVGSELLPMVERAISALSGIDLNSEA